MKRVVLAIAAALVLIALPAAAQYTSSSSTTQPSTTGTTSTGSSLTNTTPGSNSDTAAGEITNPNAPLTTPDPGVTATGTVVSWNDDQLVIRSTTGLLHIQLVPATTGLRTFTEGQQVSVDCGRNEKGVLIARQIRAAGTEVGATTGTSLNEGAAMDASASSDLDTTASVGTTASTVGSSTSTTDTSETTDTNLPATGSNAPLFGLLGLMALGGAAALRRL